LYLFIYNYDEKNRPDFLVPVYAWTDVIAVKEPRINVPPTLLICATDDPLGLAKGSIALYESLRKSGKSVALHMYAKGGHGFGMKKQGLPSDNWIQRFYEWAVSERLTTPKK
jgi:acetyl esterase/lipase